MKEKKVGMQITWGAVGLGATMLIVGGIMIIQGVEAYKTGAIIPQTTKSGPMTGLQSIITGFLAVGVGLTCLGNEVVKIVKRRRLLVQRGRRQGTYFRL